MIRASFPLLLLHVLLGCSAAGQPERVDPTPLSARSSEELDLARFFRGIEGSFVLLDGQTGRTLRHDPKRAGTRFAPASTYKVPHALIALETGVVAGANELLAWDSIVAPRQAWWPAVWTDRSHTLRSALQNSVVWFYQELARRIGPERMGAYLERFEYGNRDTSGGIDRFWLTGGLRISAEEQVEFLRRFYFGELGVSERSTRIVKEILVLEETPSYRLSGKTGWAALGEEAPQIGWLVGYLERAGDVHFFALNLDIRDNRDAAARLAITRAILGELGLLDP